MSHQSKIAYIPKDPPDVQGDKLLEITLMLRDATPRQLDTIAA